MILRELATKNYWLANKMIYFCIFSPRVALDKFSPSGGLRLETFRPKPQNLSKD